MGNGLERTGSPDILLSEILRYQKPVICRYSDSTDYFPHMPELGDKNPVSGYLLSELRRLYLGRNLIETSLKNKNLDLDLQKLHRLVEKNEGIVELDNQIALLQGRDPSTKAAIVLEREGENIRKWKEEKIEDEETSTFFAVFTEDRELTKGYYELQEVDPHAIDLIRDYIRAKLSENEDDLDQFNSEYDEFLDNNPDMIDKLRPYFQSATKKCLEIINQPF
jgi:hypothetical protein